MEKFLPRKNLGNSTNNSNIIDDLKLENEKLRLTLRKNKINNIIFEKRKKSYKKDNIEEIKKNYSINLEDIQIPNEYIIDIPKLYNKVRILYLIKYFCFYYNSSISQC